MTVYKPKARSSGVDSAFDLPLCDATRAALAYTGASIARRTV